MAPSVRKTSAGRLDRRGKQFGIRNRPGCKPVVEVRLPGLAREKLWICVRDQISAERLGKLVCRYIDGIEAFPPDHPDLPQLQEFRKKEFEACRKLTIVTNTLELRQNSLTRNIQFR